MDAGVRLLELISAREAKGEDRFTARARVFHEHPRLVDIWHTGAGPVREEGRASGRDTYGGDVLHHLGERRLASGDAPLRPGEVLCHKLGDPGAGGGFFALRAA